MFYDPECTDCADLGMISDIIRYIISWLGPFFAFAQSVFVIVDVQVKIIKMKKKPSPITAGKEFHLCECSAYKPTDPSVPGSVCFPKCILVLKILKLCQLTTVDPQLISNMTSTGALDNSTLYQLSSIIACCDSRFGNCLAL